LEERKCLAYEGIEKYENNGKREQVTLIKVKDKMAEEKRQRTSNKTNNIKNNFKKKWHK
jgi:hypothetical protein